MASRLDAFLNKAAADKWGPSKNEANAIRELCNGKIDYDEAARQFTRDVSASRTAQEAKGSLWGTWKLVEDVARKFPEHHKKLIGLIEAVRRLPDLVIGGSTVAKWSDLPVLGDVWGENVFDRDVSEYSEENVSVKAFTAQLCASNLVEQSEFLLWSELDMHYAFEATPGDASSLKASDVQMLNVNVPIAAQWILHAAEPIYQLEGEFGLRPLDGLWTGSPGFSWARWKLWKERAEWVSGLDKGLKNETREAARRMVEEMNRVAEKDGL